MITQKLRGELSMHIEVETQNIDGEVTALGSAGPFSLVVDVHPDDCICSASAPICSASATISSIAVGLASLNDLS